MFDFLARSRPKAKKPAEVAKSTPPPPHPVQVGANQCEMVRLTLHNVLKHNGIPGNWIAFEAIPIQVPNHTDAILLQLVVLKWHDALMLHALAIQHEVLEGLTHFDTTADASRYQFAWKFSPDCGCPHAPLPEPGFWSSTTQPVIAASGAQFPSPSVSAPVPASTKPKFDLPLTAADLRNDDDDDHGFAATQINDLH